MIVTKQCSTVVMETSFYTAQWRSAAKIKGKYVTLRSGISSDMYLNNPGLWGKLWSWGHQVRGHRVLLAKCQSMPCCCDVLCRYKIRHLIEQCIITFICPVDESLSTQLWRLSRALAIFWYWINSNKRKGLSLNDQTACSECTSWLIKSESALHDVASV